MRGLLLGAIGTDGTVALDAVGAAEQRAHGQSINATAAAPLMTKGWIFGKIGTWQPLRIIYVVRRLLAEMSVVHNLLAKISFEVEVIDTYKIRAVRSNYIINSWCL